MVIALAVASCSTFVAVASDAGLAGAAPVTATVPVGTSPFGVAVTPDGSHAYVANSGAGTVSVINTITNTVSGAVTVGAAPHGVAVTPDGSHVYVTNSGASTVSVISTATNTVTGTVSVGSSPQGVAISPDGSTAYVANATLQLRQRDRYR